MKPDSLCYLPHDTFGGRPHSHRPLAQKPWIAPIPGTTRISRLEENLGAVEVSLTAEDLLEIESAAARIKVQGERYPEALQKLTGL